MEKNSFSVEVDHKTEIEELWFNKRFRDIAFVNRGYCIHNNINKEAILFIGINPSYSGIKDTDCHFHDNDHKENLYKYFKKFKEIADTLKLPHSHIDLLFLRETKQNNIKKIYKTTLGKEFFKAQLQLTKLFINKAKPKIIVVANSFARELFSEKEMFKTKFDPILGTHKISEGELKNTPVFYTSMLTGQRALDKGSFERLVWHINKVLKG